MLVLTRREGQGLYIGRGVRVMLAGVYATGSVTLHVDAPKNVHVSTDDVDRLTHLHAQAVADARGGNMRRHELTLYVGAGVYIGQETHVRLLKLERDPMGLQVRVGVSAPRHVAVSRTDFSEAEHMRFQLQREGGGTP